VKLKSFAASEVFGYLNFRIEFHPDLSFLIGVNGSGKTTVLRLIQALLTPSFPDLQSIPYRMVTVAYDDAGTSIEIVSTKLGEQLELSVSSIPEPLVVPAIGQEEMSILAREEGSAEFFREYQLKYSDHPVFKFISKTNAPVFLGLERTHKGTQESERFYDRERMLANSARHGLRGRRILKGSLAAGLMETQALVQEAYRRFRRIEDQHSERLRESIVLSAFKYSDLSFPAEGPSSLLPTWVEQKEILQRKAEIELALGKIGLSGEKIRKVLEEFFRRLEELFGSMARVQQSEGIPIEWVLNKAQIDRVSDLIEIIDAHKSKVDKLFLPINTFLQSVNSFYEDSGKSLAIDTVGQLTVLRPDQKMVAIEALSSGERQLLIIFAHLLFNEYGTRSNVFIIDEPELSLHLKWQEKFVTKALEVGPKTQLILATHSPEIVGGYEKKSIPV